MGVSEVKDRLEASNAKSPTNPTCARSDTAKALLRSD
jgi:hypothetical protein